MYQKIIEVLPQLTPRYSVALEGDLCLENAEAKAFVYAYEREGKTFYRCAARAVDYEQEVRHLFEVDSSEETANILQDYFQASAYSHSRRRNHHRTRSHPSPNQRRA